MRIQGRLIVLTGVTRGLGRALLERFAVMGHTVAGCARTRKQVDALSREFRPPHSFATVDVSNDAKVHRWAEFVLTTQGTPDLVVNNAGLINELAPLWRVPREEFDEILDVNVKGTANVIRHFLPAMVRRKAGVIVNLSSGWGRSASAQVAPYCATKWAIEGLTRSLAEELPPGMAAVPLNPGIIRTEMLKTCFGSQAASYPLPEEWARRAAPFLLGLGPKDNGRPRDVP